MTLLYIDGFEHGSLVTGQGGVYGSVDSSITISTSYSHTGSNSLKIDPTYSVTTKSFSSGIRTMSGSFYYMWRVGVPTSLSAPMLTIANANGEFSVVWSATNDELGIKIGTSASVMFSGNYYSLNTWYRVDFKIDCSSGTATMYAMVDGADEINTSRSQTAADLTSARMGFYAGYASGTYDTYMDDVVLTDSTADYPIGVHYVDGLRVTADGTHNEGGGNFYNSSGGSLSDLSTNVYTFIDETNVASTTTYIEQRSNDTSAYMESTFADISSSGGPRGIYYRQVSTDSSDIGANSAETRLYLSDGTLVQDIRPSTSDPGSPDTWTMYQGASAVPSGGWTTDGVNGLKLRMGYADGDPDARFGSVILEAWVGSQNASVTTTTVTATATIPTPTTSAGASLTTTSVTPTTAVPASPTALTTAAPPLSSVLPIAEIPSPTTLGGATATPEVLNGTTFVPGPSISIDGSMAVFPSVVTLQGYLWTPTVTVVTPDASPTTVDFGVTTTVPTPVTTGQLVTLVIPSTVGATTAIPSPTIQATISTSLTAPTVATRAFVLGPTLGGDAILQPITWRVDVHQLNNETALLTDLNVQSFRIIYSLNGPGSFEADMSLVDPHATSSYLEPGQREIRVYRDDILVWGGVLWRVDLDARNYKLRLSGEGYFSWLRRRLVENDLLRFDDDQGDIAWDLIDYSQDNHGTFGFTDGHNQTGVLVDRVYCAMGLPNVGESIQELSEMDDSFDFWVTPTISDPSNKVFKTPLPAGGAARRGSDLSSSVILDQDNSQTLEYTIDASEVANRIWGVGTGECNPPSFEAHANTSIAEFGELHAVAEFDDLDHQPSVEAHTREELRIRKQARHQATVKIYEDDLSWGTFDVGDIVTMSSNRGYVANSLSMRCLSFEVNVSPPDIVFYTVTLDSVVT